MSDDTYELDVEFDDLEQMDEPGAFDDAALFAREVSDYSGGFEAFGADETFDGADGIDDPNLAASGTASIELPPERVRFAAPLTLCEEGHESEELQGAVVNLSTSGVAILSPVELTPGQRVWASFRLGLAEEPLTFLCEVIWRRPPRDGHFACGLAFRSMTEEESVRVAMTVRERAEGRAGEWPLPVMPEDSPPPPRTANPWVTAAAGMVAGIVLAVVVSAIPRSATTASPPQAEVEPPVAPAPQQVATADTPAPAAGIRVATDKAISVEEPESEPVAPAPPEPVEAQAIAPVARPDDPAPAPARPEAETRLPRIAERSATAEEIDYLRPSGSSDQMAVALLADGPVQGHSSFWLKNPRRLVIDVPARKSGFARKTYGIEHPLASRLRVGNHPDKVRYVIETADEVGSDVEAIAKGSALVVTLKRGG